jgi:hypothetical protein
MPCHATAPTVEQTDWGHINSLYEQLAQLTGSPVVELNRAAVGMARGPQAGLDAVDRLRDEPLLRGYHLLPGVRGDLLEKLGRLEEAGAEFSRAAELAKNERERQLRWTGQEHAGIRCRSATAARGLHRGDRLAHGVREVPPDEARAACFQGWLALESSGTHTDPGEMGLGTNFGRLKRT